MFRERSVKADTSVSIACQRAEALFHGFFLAKEGLRLNDLSGIIRSVSHLLLYLKGAVVGGMPASKALGLFIHDYFEKHRGMQAQESSLRSVLDVVIGVLRLNPPGPIGSPIVRGLAVDLHAALREHCGSFCTTQSQKSDLVARVHRALTAVGVTESMGFSEVVDHLRRNEANHDAHPFTMEERCGQRKGGEQGRAISEGQMRQGLALARNHFLEVETDEVEWTPGPPNGKFPAMPQAMDEVLQAKFESFLRVRQRAPGAGVH